MKKILTIILTLALSIVACFGLTACGGQSDLERVKANEKLVVGVTVYPPMDYIDGDGEWAGFDADLAKMYAESLGVNCQIVIITWGNKVAEINSKQIDLIWNGMTASEELGQQIDFSVSYAKNAQVAVVKADNTSIATANDVKNAKIAVENGSAGETVAEELNAANITPVTAQLDALVEVKSGTSDVAIIDITMAQSLVGKGDYSTLKIVSGLSFGDEIFAVGLRKGSDLKESLDAFLKAKYADGTIGQLALQYGVGINTEALA